MLSPREYNCHISYTCDAKGPGMPLGCLAEISCAAPFCTAVHTGSCTYDRLTFIVKIEICVLSAAVQLTLNI